MWHTPNKRRPRNRRPSGPSSQHSNRLRRDTSATATTRQSSSTIALHTYPTHYLPSYIFGHSTPPSASISPTHASIVLPSEKPLSPHQPDTYKHTQGQTGAHDLLQQMLNPLVSNHDAAPPLEGLVQDDISEMTHGDEEEEAKQPLPPPPPKEWTKNVYTF